jgi:predicted alpha/beta superfamily hydrolase
MRQNPVHLSVENVPIDSKYHQTGGKHNIYAEFIDPKHKPNVSESIRRPIRRKPAKSKEK